MIDFRRLVKAGVHFGHEVSRWNPDMAPYIWGKKNNIHLIDVSKTALQLEKASQFLKQIISEGKQILLVGTKRPAQAIIEQTAQKLKVPYVSHRWVGGTLSNYAQVKKSLTKLLHFEDVLVRAEQYPHYTKKELNTIQKQVERLKKNVGGIRSLTWPVGALVVIDVNKEHAAIKEAATMGVPVVALVDTNSDPSAVDYVIPANDDSPASIQVVVEYLADAIEQGKTIAAERKVQAAQEEAAAVTQEEPTEILALSEEEETEETKRSKKAETSKVIKRPKKMVEKSDK